MIYKELHKTPHVRDKLFSMQLELGNIIKSGQLREMWDIASRTDVRFNMVCPRPLYWHIEAVILVSVSFVNKS